MTARRAAGAGMAIAVVFSVAVFAVADPTELLSATFGRAPLATGPAAPADPAAAGSVAGQIAVPPPSAGTSGKGRAVGGTFRSAVLDRTMPITVYLPPGYDANPAVRYPTVYLLHGGGGTNTEWADYSVLDAADRLMGGGAIPPYIIVLPQGDQEYWVDHVIDQATGANGERWGTYVAREVVPFVDARYRTIARQDKRAIGGLSMGAHGAMQLPMSFPGIWSVIGAHSPSIRPIGDAPTYLGKGAEFAARDPLSLVMAKPDLARAYTWRIDVGDVDPWLEPAAAVAAALTALGIPHEWRVYPGDHSAAYWEAHVEDTLRYYAAAFSCGRAVPCPTRP